MPNRAVDGAGDDELAMNWPVGHAYRKPIYVQNLLSDTIGQINLPSWCHSVFSRLDYFVWWWDDKCWTAMSLPWAVASKIDPESDRTAKQFSNFPSCFSQTCVSSGPASIHILYIYIYVFEASIMILPVLGFASGTPMKYSHSGFPIRPFSII